MLNDGCGTEPRTRGLLKVLAQMEECLRELDRLGAGLAGPRLAHAVEDLRLEIDNSGCSASEDDELEAEVSEDAIASQTTRAKA
jgi:hypothetical protein